MRFQDAARDGRAVVYAAIQADPLVARAAEQLRGPYARRGLDLMIDVDPQWFT